jgi:hypothetical protein
LPGVDTTVDAARLEARATMLTALEPFSGHSERKAEDGSTREARRAGK